MDIEKGSDHWRPVSQVFSLSRFLVGLLGLLMGASLATAQSFSDWLKYEEGISIRYMIANISPADGIPGAVMASPDDGIPHYRQNWVRDAASVMRTVVHLYQASEDGEKKAEYGAILTDYVRFCRVTQTIPNRSGGPGEPIFHLDGTPNDEEWGRPQIDGPASRAIVLTEWARLLLREGQTALVRGLLYDGALPSLTVIKYDLEYISQNWRTPSYDLWEESRGHHFYTLIMSYRALSDGAALARDLGDDKAADWYETQATSLRSLLQEFWRPDLGFIAWTRNQDDSGAMSQRKSLIDSSVVLGVLLGQTKEPIFPFDDPRVLMTVRRVEEAFSDLYPINRNAAVGVAIGRYPDDTYDGYRTGSIGNPWVSMTAAFAQFYYRLSRQLEERGRVVIDFGSEAFFQDLASYDPLLRLKVREYTAEDPEFSRIRAALVAKGDGFLKRIGRHANPDGSLSEQFSRDTGFMQGASHLSASYATFLWAVWARDGSFP